MMSIFNRAISAKTGILTLIGLCLLTSCLVLPGCGAAQAPAPPTPRDIPFSLLASQNYHYDRALDFTVITNQDQYSTFEQVPEVDFDNLIVLGVSYSLPSPGYAFSVQAITQIGTTVNVQTKMTPPDPGGIYPQVLVPGYYLLLVDRAAFDPGGELHFVLLDENGGQVAEVVASV